jgi:hypothetical protein
MGFDGFWYGLYESTGSYVQVVRNVMIPNDSINSQSPRLSMLSVGLGQFECIVILILLYFSLYSPLLAVDPALPAVVGWSFLAVVEPVDPVMDDFTDGAVVDSPIDTIEDTDPVADGEAENSALDSVSASDSNMAAFSFGIFLALM